MCKIRTTCLHIGKKFKYLGPFFLRTGRLNMTPEGPEGVGSSKTSKPISRVNPVQSILQPAPLSMKNGLFSLVD